VYIFWSIISHPIIDCICDPEIYFQFSLLKRMQAFW